MTLIEILTVISLFCPNIETISYKNGSTYYGKPSDHYSDPDCVKKVWKCIDKARQKSKLCGGGFQEKENQERFKNNCENIYMEKCFR